MSENEEVTLCQATTKAGNRCRNRTSEGSAFCHVHRSQTDEPSSAVAGGDGEPREREARFSDAEREEFRQLAAELNRLAEELDEMTTGFTPPPLTAAGLADIVYRNIYRFTPTAQREIIDTLRAGLEGTSREDLLNPDTWKGFWYILNYMAQNQKSEMEQRLNQRLSTLPGMALLSDIHSGLKGSSPQDFLEPETWKGLYYLVNHTARLQIGEMKRRILGKKE